MQAEVEFEDKGKEETEEDTETQRSAILYETVLNKLSGQMIVRSI